jgi:hypothetical protein
MLRKNNIKSYLLVVGLAMAIFLPSTTFATIYNGLTPSGNTTETITVEKFHESASKLSNIHFGLVTPSPMIEKRKKNRVPQSILLAAKKDRDKLSIGSQRSSKGKYYGDKTANSSASSSYQITSNGNQTHTLTRQGVQMEPIPAEEVESLRNFIENIVGDADYMIALQDAQGILDAVVEGSVLGGFSGDMSSGVGSEFLPEDNDSLLNREAVGKSLTNKYDPLRELPSGSINDQGKAGGPGFTFKDFDESLNRILRNDGVSKVFGTGATAVGAGGRTLFATAAAGAAQITFSVALTGIGYAIGIYNSLPDIYTTDAEKYLAFIDKQSWTDKQKDAARKEFYKRKCKDTGTYCKEAGMPKPNENDDKETPIENDDKPAPNDFGNGGVPKRIELTKAQKDWWATVLTTGWIPEETNPGPEGGEAGGVQLSPEEHARLLQELMIMADIPWNPTSGQPVPDKDYRNYHVADNGTITMTDLTLAGQPLDDDDGSFGIKNQPKKLGGPKPVGGIDQDAPEGEPFHNPTGDRSNVPFPAPMK